jgi:hypothetical protein
MLKAEDIFEAALSASSDARLELENLRMPKRMGIDEQDPEVGAEGIVRNEYST